MKCCIHEEFKDARNVLKSNRSPPCGEKKVSWEKKLGLPNLLNPAGVSSISNPSPAVLLSPECFLDWNWGNSVAVRGNTLRKNEKNPMEKCHVLRHLQKRESHRCYVLLGFSFLQVSKYIAFSHAEIACSNLTSPIHESCL